MNQLSRVAEFHVCKAEDECATASYATRRCVSGCGTFCRYPACARLQGASSPLQPASQLPDEIWLLVLACGGLRTSATAAACSTCFRSFHRAVISSSALLARALLVDHGPAGAIANLYSSTAGHPNDRHAVQSDADIAAAFRHLVVLSAGPDGPAASAAAAIVESSAFAAIVAVRAIAALDAATTGTNRAAVGAAPDAIIPAATQQDAASIEWNCGGAPAFRQLVGELLCAAAAAGHILMAATALAFGAVELDRALVAASATGRRRVVRLLLANGADPDAVEPYGHCALYEAARTGNTDVVEVLLDAGARIDGADAAAAATAARPYDGRISALAPSLGARPWPNANPWRPWAAVGGAGVKFNGGPGVASEEAAQYLEPLPLRVPVPLAAAAAAACGRSATSTTAVFDVRGFFQESGDGGAAAASPPPRLDEQLKTPSAAAAAAAMTWRELDEEGDGGDGDDDDDEGIGGSGQGGVRVLDTPVRNTAGAAAITPRPRLPPPLPRRKPRLPLPPNLPSLPLMPSLLGPAPPPLPPALMHLLAGDRGPQHRHGGSAPLLAACQGGHSTTAALLLRRGAKVDTDGGAELLAASHPQVVDELMAAEPGLSVHLGPALLAAASANRVEVVSALLRHGADPAFNGGMVLQEAAFRSHLKVLEVLLAVDCVRFRDSGALTTALKWARCFGRSEVMQLLVRFGS